MEERAWRRVLFPLLLCLSSFIFSCHGLIAPPSVFCQNVPLTKGNFSMLAKPWPGMTNTSYRYSSVVFNCTTNDKDASVVLEHRVGSGWQKVIDLTSTFPNGSFIQRGQIIVLKKLLDSQEGLYRCIAKSWRQDEICLFFGSLFSAPNIVNIVILPHQRPVTVVKGESLILSCRAPGLHDYLTWYKRTSGIDKEIDGSVITRSNEVIGEYHGILTINIPHAKLADAGTYVCVRFLKLEGVKREKTASVIVKDFTKPVIQLYPTNNKVDVIEKTGSLKLTCKYISGDPQPTLEWRNPGGILLEKCAKLAPSWPNCTLTVTNDVYANVRYTCMALSPAGSSSLNIDVNVLVAVELEKQGDKKFVAGFYERPELTCKIKRANPLPIITWFYQDWSCPSETCTPRDDSWVSDFPKISLTPDANVATNESKLVVPASKVAAFYSCQASNQIGMEIKKDFFNVTLHRVEKAAKSFGLSADEKSINENDTFSLNCSAAANIFNKIKWMKEGKDFMEKTPRIKITNIDAKNYLRISVITFERVELNDAGTYTCIGFERRGGIEKAQHNLTVLALRRPKITGLKDLVLNQSNQHAVIFCNATGNPMPSLTWKFRGKMINEKMIIYGVKDCQTRTPGFYYISESQKSKLVLCNLDYKKFQGEYECLAKNKVGSDKSKFSVIILVKPSILAWNDKVGFQPGKSASLFCEAEGNPAPNVTIWKMKGKSKIALKNVQRYGNGTAYVKFKTNKDTKGKYACTAENSFGVAEKFTVLSEADVATRIQEKPVSTGVIATIVVCSVLFIIIILVAAFCYKRKLDEKYAPYLKPNRYFQMDPDRSLFEQSSELPYDPDWEFPREKLTFIKMIGSGAFGEVWLTEAEGILTLEPRDKTSSASKRRSKIKRSQRYTHVQGKDRKKSQQAEALSKKTLVAVKTLKGDASDTEYKDLASELKILIHIGENKQIVNLLGACTRGGKLCVILEYCPHGSLLNFLRERRDIFEPIWYKQETDMGNELTHIDLTMVAYQIAKGMDFLASKKCVHRDVAARNVLVGVDYIVKIADFGLARDIYKDEFYMKSTSGLLPVKWMAPESLFDKIYTSQSDVWSYGIVLWEIFTLGGSPYPGLPTEDLFSFLEQGRRMDQSELCPLEIYAVMRDCWERNPNDRPLFSQIADRIGQIISNHSGQDNPYLEFEKEEAGAQAKDTDYLVPVIEQSGASNSKQIGDHGHISDEYIGIVHDNDASTKRSGRPSNASYENENELRLNLINGSTSTDYANTRPYHDEDEAEV